MNGSRDFGSPIPDEKLNALMNVLVNIWFKKWRHMATTENRFDQAWKELDVIMNQGQAYPVVRHLCIALLYELDARLHGGYTETTRDKLLTLIRQEAPQ